MNRTKTDLVSRMAKEVGTPKMAAEEALSGILDFVAETLAKGGKVSIAGFGVFEVTHRAERAGRNPRTGESLQIPASNSVRFKAGKRFTERVNPLPRRPPTSGGETSPTTRAGTHRGYRPFL